MRVSVIVGVKVVRSHNQVMWSRSSVDAVLPASLVLAAASKQGVDLSVLVSELPKRYTGSDRLKEFPTERSKALLADWEADVKGVKDTLELASDVVTSNTTDGLRLTLENGDIVHLRPSGNAPEFRCYAESDSAEKADQLVVSVLNKLAAYR